MEEKKETSVQRKRPVLRLALLILFLCMTVFGAYGLYFTYTQPHYPATVLSVGDVVSRSRRTRRGSSTSYHTTLRVLYEENGTEQRADVAFVYSNRWFPPKAGTRIEVSRGLLGNVIAWPDEDTNVLLWIATVFGAAGLIVLRLVLRALDSHEEAALRGLQNPEEETAPVDSRARIITDRVTQQPDGTWRWRRALSAEAQQRNDRFVNRMLIGIAAFILAVGVFLCLQVHSWEPFPIVLLSDAVYLAIAFFVLWIVRRRPEPRMELYELREDGAKTGYGRNANYFPWSGVRRVSFQYDCVLLKGNVFQLRIYAPPEDMPFVRSFVEQRIPASAEIVR